MVVIKVASSSTGKFNRAGSQTPWSRRYDISSGVQNMIEVKEAKNIRQPASFSDMDANAIIKIQEYSLAFTFLIMLMQIGEATKHAIGSTILLNSIFAGPMSGASMNPARMPHPSIVSNQYRGLLVYMLGSAVGAIVGARAHNIIRFTDKPLADIVKNSSILQRKDAEK
ncbi:major intrinsic protein, Aquaporin-like protein [Artemisia annua]|uniref:Major intrinsic protein, Aquaporin-like protein n=1 Tax=Artemisia annua TaxID=35608 RepID=A0A2U1MHX0_ARTAN|nr:major intrinsic protein, Aquaporin-like protein [Artemisia annua]